MSSTNKSQYKCESCIEWYDDGPRIPKEFPCHHNICALCVLQLMGESPKMNSGNTIPLGRSISCPICDSQFVSDDITTNSDLASKITALIGLESLILTDPDVKEPQKPKTKLTDIKPKTEKNDQLDPQPTEPNPYSEPYPSEPPPPLPEPQPSEPKPYPEDPQPSEPKPSPDPQPSEPEPSPDSHPSEPKHSPEPQPSKPHPLSPKIKPSSFDIDPEPPSGFQTPNSQAWNVHPLPYLQPQGPDGYPQYDLPYQEPQQNFAGAQGLGWTTPTMAPPPPPANTPLVEDGDQFRIGWSFPVGPQLDQSYPASPFVGMPQPMTQTMPQPYGSNPDDSHLSGYYQQ